MDQTKILYKSFNIKLHVIKKVVYNVHDYRNPRNKNKYFIQCLYKINMNRLSMHNYPKKQNPIQYANKLLLLKIILQYFNSVD